MADHFVLHNDGGNEPDNSPMNPHNNPPMNPPGNAPGNAHGNFGPPPYVEPPLTLEYIRSDRNAVDARQAHGRASNHRQLTLEEKEHLSLIFTALKRTTHAPNPITVAGWHNFLNAILTCWTTRSAAPKNPVLPLKRFTETHIQVGTLKCDHPLSNAQLREGVRVQKDERKRGAPVFFGLTLDYETGSVLWTWRDAKCVGISSDHVRLDEVMNSHTIRREAMINYDSFELSRIREYNKALVIACARRAIKKWVEAGTGRDCDLEQSDTPSDLKYPMTAAVMARDEGRRLIAAAAEAAENVENISDDII
ncbi:hypothetical protein FAVG1_01002 [Fusarium avenaceum]|nr:hypothetical protein FAVG1_01002 [Fusarium avenaceum]